MNRKARLNYIHALSSQVERKKMYKAKKQWVVAGISFLVATGMGAIGSHLITHADTTQAKAQTTLPINKNSQSKQIGSAASNFHNKLVSNAVSPANQKLQASSGNQAPNAKASATPVSSKVSGSQVSSSNAKSSVSSNVATSGNGMNTLKLGNSSEQNKGWNYVQNGIKPSFNSNSQSFVTNKPLVKLVNLGQAPSNIITGTFGTGSQKYHTNPASFTFNKSTGDLVISNGDMTDYHKQQGWTNSMFGFSWPSQIPTSDVTSISFEGHVIAPNNSCELFANKSDTNKNIEWATNQAYPKFKKLQSIDLTNLDFNGVITSKDLFAGDYNLSSIKGLSENTANNTDISYMFFDDKALTSVDLTHFNTAGLDWIDHMFESDTSLQSVNLSNTNTLHVPLTGAQPPFDNWFYNTPNLQTLMIGPNTKIHGNTGLITNRSWAHIDASGVHIIQAGSNQFKYSPGLWTAIPTKNSDIGLWALEEAGQYTDLTSASASSAIQSAEASASNAISNDDKSISTDSSEIQKLQNDGSITLAFSVGNQVVSGKNGKYITLDDAQVRSQPKYNNSSDTYDVTNLLTPYVPQGYHISNNGQVYAKINPLNDGFAQILLQPNNVGTMPPVRLGSFRKFGLGDPAPVQNHVIPLTGNSVTYNGNVTLRFKDNNGNIVYSTSKPYLVKTETGDTVNLLKPSNYLNGSTVTDKYGNSIVLSGNNFQSDSSNNVEKTTVQPSDAPQESGNTKTNNYTLTYDAQPTKDTITYDLSGSNIPVNYVGNKGYLKTTSAINGSYDTKISDNTIKNNVPAGYKVVSNNSQYFDNGNHTVEITPNTENVTITYKDTDSNGVITNGQNSQSSISKTIQVPYDTNISDVTKKVPVPNGYSLTSSDNKSDTITKNNQSDTLNVSGNQMSGNVNLTINKYDNGTQVGKSTTTSVPVSGKVGTKYPIDPNSYAPTGYKLHGADNIQYGTFLPNDKLSQSAMTFDYDAQTGNTITINYINQHGKQFAEYINGNVDDTGKIADKAPVPAGYTVNPSQPTDQNSSYRITNRNQTINIHVTGKPASEVDNTNHGKVTIYINKLVNGKSVSDSPKTVDLSGKEVGDSYTIKPSSYTPTDYQPESNQSITSTVTPNGLSTDDNSKAQMTFNYDAQTGTPITVTYINQKNNKVYSDKNVTGLVDSTIDVTKQAKVPSNYTLNNGQNTQYTITTKPQSVTLYVTGNTVPSNQGRATTPSDNASAKTINSDISHNAAKGYVTVTVIEKDSNGKQINKYYHNVNEVNKNSRAGDTYSITSVTVNPNSDAYNADSNNGSIKGTVQADGSVQSNPTTATFYYTLKANSIEPISVTYENQNNAYIDIQQGSNYGKITKNSNAATQTFSDATLAKLAGSGKTVDITGLLKAPKGYHFNVAKSDITDNKGNHLNNIPLVFEGNGQHKTEQVFLSIEMPTPKSNPKDSSANTKIASDSAAVNSESQSATSMMSNSAISGSTRTSISSASNAIASASSAIYNDSGKGASAESDANDALASASSAYTSASTIASSAVSSASASESAGSLASLISNDVSNDVNNATKNIKPATVPTSLTSGEVQDLANAVDANMKSTTSVVTNTVVDSSALTSLTNEVASENQEISNLANKPASNTTNTIDYNYFNNLVNSGVSQLTDVVNKDFKANIHNTAKAHTTNITRGFKPVKKHIRWIMITKPVKLYNKHGVAKTLRPSKVTLDVHSVYKAHGHFVFKVSYHHHTYFMADNHSTFKNAYLAQGKFAGRRVRVTKPVYEFRHKDHDIVKLLHKGSALRIRRVVKIGNFNMTRIQLSNGNWISANKNYIKVL